MNFDMTLWLFASVAGLLIGFNKTTGLSVMGIFIVALMSMIFPAKEAVGILLPMLIMGDIIAVTVYRRSVVWKHLFSLVPWVLLGILAGYFLLWKVNSEHLQYILGVLILILIALQVVKERLGPKMDKALPNSVWFIGTTGILAGFTTMIGNVAGAVMSVYLLAKRLPKQEFVGTGAWFFLFVNVIKVPFYIHLDMITLKSLSFDAIAIPAILLGAYLGIKIFPLIPQIWFQRIILVLGAIGGMRLIVPEMFQFFLTWHIIAGITCFIAGALSASARKQKGMHTEAGEIYHGAYFVVFITTVAMALMRWEENAHLLYIGAFSYGLALSGYMAGKKRRHNWLVLHISGMLGSYIGMITAVLVVNGPNIPFLNSLPDIWLWFIPTIVGTPIIFWTVFRFKKARKIQHRSLKI